MKALNRFPLSFEKTSRFWAVLLFVLLLAAPAWAKMEHTVHFQGTAYELHIYKIYGQKPGKTLMLIGGIQGNEPGGFLSADLYADMTLEKGNLIVVPRANFYSIMLNQRGPNGDMNRKFNKPAKPKNEAKIVAILKGLIAESDCLLNLHDGSGYYRPTWISPQMNPRRFGQSVIADADVYTHPGTGRTVQLGGMGRAICEEINQSIDNPLYRFHFNDHRTLEPDSPNKEQRGSATFYALTQVGIPAFGIETSKDLPTIELKVRHHNLAINACMRMLDIVPEHPAVNVKRPVLHYLVISVNNNRPMVVSDNETLALNRGDKIFISHIESNYQRGLSVDILGVGGINDTRRFFVIKQPTSVIVRKDHLQCGWVRLAVKHRAGKQMAESNPVAQYFLVEVNGDQRLVASGQTMRLIKGDTVKLLDAWTARGQRGAFALNFKGFVKDKSSNTGDDQDVLINTSRGLMKDWSVEKQGKLYRVVAERGRNSYGEFFVQLTEPGLDYVIVQGEGEEKYAVSPGETLILDPDEQIQVIDLKANFDTRYGISFLLSQPGREVALDVGERIRLNDVLAQGGVHVDRSKLQVLRHNNPIGHIFLRTRPATAGSGEAGRTG